MNLSGFSILLVFIILSFLMAVAMLIFSFIVQVRKPTKLKNQLYECGLNPKNEARIQFSSKYYIFAIIFLIFDIETVFLLPWAILLKRIGYLALFEGVIFILLLGFSYLYLYKKGAFSWDYESNY